MWLPFQIDSFAGSEATHFLLLAWCELFGTYTPDTCQPRLYHTASLVTELRTVAERAVTLERWQRHHEMVRAELRASIEAESTFLDRLPRYRWALERLAEEKGAANASVLARTLEAQTHDYEAAAIDALRGSVVGLPGNKDSALAALQRFATVAIQAGRTADECLNFVTEQRLHRSPEELVEDLILFARPAPGDFRCYFTLEGEARDAQRIVRPAGFELVAREEFTSISGESFGENHVTVAAPESANLPHAAVQQASARLRRAVDVFNFYRNQPTLTLLPNAWAVAADGSITAIPLGDFALRRLQPRKNAPALTQELLESVPAERLNNRLLNALEHCSLAQSSANPRVQLVGMWSAVECLSGASRAQSILNQVSANILPAVIFQRTEKTIRYLGVQLHKIRKHRPEASLGDGFPRSTKFLYPEELLITLCRPENHPHLISLFAYAAPNPLLCNRLFTTWKLFHRPGALAGKLAAARQTLDWHLARIYRARNLIVHEGVEVPHLPWLLDHLHYYFTAACGRVLTALRLHPQWTVEEGMAWWRLRCDYLIDRLKDAPQRLTVADVFRAPEILGEASPWPEVQNQTSPSASQ